MSNILRETVVEKARPNAKSSAKSTIVTISIVETIGQGPTDYTVVVYYTNLFRDKSRYAGQSIPLEIAQQYFDTTLMDHLKRGYKIIREKNHLPLKTKNKVKKYVPSGDPSTIAVDDSYYEFV